MMRVLEWQRCNASMLTPFEGLCRSFLLSVQASQTNCAASFGEASPAHWSCSAERS